MKTSCSRRHPTVLVLSTCLMVCAATTAASAQGLPQRPGAAERGAGVSGAMDQMNRRDLQTRDRNEGFAIHKSATQDTILYPNATRVSPDAEVRGRVAVQLREITELYDADKGSEARILADQVLADEDNNAYARSFASQFAGQVAYNGKDIPAAIEYYRQAIDTDGLDNDSHYNAMLNLAQLQQANEQYADSLATYERFFSETKSAQPEHLMMKGQTLLLMERYPEAAKVMERALAASDAPKPEWKALLMQAHAQGGNGSEAIKMAEEVAQSQPGDKRAQMNLAVVYQQAGLQEKATSVMEELRGSGKLTEANEYRQLYATYINMEGREKQAVEVIQDGLQKGILGPDFNTYIALAQGYYFSDQPGPAIEAYQKAAPLDDDGETYLNLAKVLNNEGRLAEAKAAAEQALAKGVEKPEQATSIISR